MDVGLHEDISNTEINNNNIVFRHHPRHKSLQQTRLNWMVEGKRMRNRPTDNILEWAGVGIVWRMTADEDRISVVVNSPEDGT